MALSLKETETQHSRLPRVTAKMQLNCVWEHQGPVGEHQNLSREWSVGTHQSPVGAQESPVLQAFSWLAVYESELPLPAERYFFSHLRADGALFSRLLCSLLWHIMNCSSFQSTLLSTLTLGWPFGDCPKIKRNKVSNQSLCVVLFQSEMGKSWD